MFISAPDSVSYVLRQVGTPITVPSQGGMDLGRIASMELNHKAVDTARRGDSVAMKLDPTNTTEGSRLYGRHFDFKARRLIMLRMHLRLLGGHIPALVLLLAEGLLLMYVCSLQDELVSRISRKSIDLLKEHFRDDMSKDDWRLVVKLKAMFDIA